MADHIEYHWPNLTTRVAATTGSEPEQAPKRPRLAEKQRDTSYIDTIFAMFVYEGNREGSGFVIGEASHYCRDHTNRTGHVYRARHAQDAHGTGEFFPTFAEARECIIDRLRAEGFDVVEASKVNHG